MHSFDNEQKSTGSALSHAASDGRRPEISLVCLFGLIEDVGQMALPAVLTVVHGSHEDTGTALKGN